MTIQENPLPHRSTRSPARSAVLGLALLSLCVGLPASSQKDGSSLFGEIIDVRVINLEAVVTDKKGDRIHGLTADDFRLTVDGVEVPIGYFSEVLGGGAAPAGKNPSDAVSLPALAAGKPVGTSYLVFIDDFFTIGAQRDLVLKNLREEVGRLGPEDRMAIVAFGDMERRGTLSYVAAQTGGRPLFAGNRLKALEIVQEDVGSYYWLGFQTDRLGSDEGHKIRLEAIRPGLKIRHRRGYLDLSRRAEAAMKTQSALLLGSIEGLAARSGLTAVAGDSHKAGWGKMEVAVETGVPLEDVTVLPTADGWATEVELLIAVQDKSGAQADIPALPLRLTVDEEPGPESYARYTTTLKLRREAHDVVVSIHDPATGRVLMRVLEISP